KDGRIVADDEATEKAPAMPPRLSQIEVTAPEPDPALSVLDQSRRWRVMDHHEVRIQTQTLRIAQVNFEVDLLHLFRQMVILALEGIGQSPGDLEEFLIACQDFPASINTQPVHHGH